MKKLLLSLLSGLPILASAQVTLNASMAPSINSVYIYNDANVPSPPFTFSKSGTNNTWDFTVAAPVPGADDTTFVVSPSSVPLAGSFPSATHCTYEGGEPSYTMIQVTPSGINFLGAVADMTGSGSLLALVANPPLTAMAFPYGYGSTGSGTTNIELFLTGAAIGQPSIDSAHYKSTISGLRDVIAEGNMIIPAGTYPAILERSIDSSIDTLWIKGALTFNQWVVAPGFPQNSLDSAFYWYTAQSLLPYAHALYDNTGLHDVNYFKSVTTGVNENQNTLKVSVYPNPVSDVIYFTGSESKYETRVYNSNGQMIEHMNSADKLDVSSFSNGIYFLRLNDAAGNSRSVKFIKD